MKRSILSEDNSTFIRQKFDRDEVVDFLIVGAQKAGTMAAVKNLNKHPDIFVLSECHFFDLYWDMSLSWYKKQFHINNRLQKPVIGEKTPGIQCRTRLSYKRMTLPLW